MNRTGLDTFFGRKEPLNLLHRRVQDLKEGYRQNLAFLSPRYTGKSFLLQKFISELEDPQILVMSCDLEERDLADFYHKFIGGLLYQYAHQVEASPQQDIPLLCELLEPRLPHTVRAVRRIRSLLNHHKSLEAYREIIALPQILAREARKFCVLVFDEFQALEDFGVPDAFQELGKAIMTQKSCLYVVTSSQPPAAHKILGERLSLLFGNFEIVDIEPFDSRTSLGFVKQQFDSLRIKSDLQSFLIDFTGGHPLYLQTLCAEVVALSALHRQQEIFMPLLTKAVENVLFNPWGVLSRHFDLHMNRVSHGRCYPACSRALMVLSQGKQKLADVARLVGMPQSRMKKILSGLIEQGVVSRNGKFFLIPDKLFRYWIKYIYQKRRRDLDLGEQRRHDDFCTEFSRAVDIFRLCAQKDLAARMTELLYCFEDEAYHINGRRYKLTLFRQVIPMKLKKSSGEFFDALKAMADDGTWFVVLNTGRVDENDIHAILKESRKQDVKPQRCVLVAMSNLDENTRVRALQERMWIWNESELKTLLNLFDQPLII